MSIHHVFPFTSRECKLFATYTTYKDTWFLNVWTLMCSSRFSFVVADDHIVCYDMSTLYEQPVCVFLNWSSG